MAARARMPLRRAGTASFFASLGGLLVTHLAFGPGTLVVSVFLVWIYLALLVGGFVTVFLLAPATRTWRGPLRLGALAAVAGAAAGAGLAWLFFGQDPRAASRGAVVGGVTATIAGVLHAWLCGGFRR